MSTINQAQELFKAAHLSKLGRICDIPEERPVNHPVIQLRPPLAYALLTTALLSACVTGDGDGEAVLAPSYETFSSTSNATSTLGGVALKLREDPDQVTLSASSGSYQHSSGATVLNDGTYELVDADGFAFDSLLTDGISVLISTPSQGFSNNYSYARVYTQGYLVAATPYSTTGVFGIVTSASDIPSSGSATYTGEAAGGYSNTTDAYDLEGGASTITANFGTQTVNVAMTGFTAVNKSSGSSEDVGFNQVRITGMRIDRNQFEGGTIATLANGTEVQIVGTVSQQEALGRFFGLDSTNAPDEAGGIAYLAGENGSVTTIFLAD